MGVGCIQKLPELLREDSISNVLLVTTAGFISRGSLEPLMSLLNKKGIRYSVFSDVTPDPTVECVEQAVQQYQKNGCDGIVAIGGGSVIDCAKIVGARITRPEKSVKQMMGTMKIGRRIPNLYAVPTTAGTGSEVTAGAVITDTVDGTHYKITIGDVNLVPYYAILDAEITCALPPAITSVTGMDVLTHAVEAYTNCFASKKTKKYAGEAVKLVFENLMTAYENGTDISAREKMLEASYFGGVAITNNYVGYVHAIAHGIGGLYGVPHGMANAILLPVILEKYGEAVFKSLAQLGNLVGIKGNSEKEKAEGFINAIRRMNEEMNIPQKFIKLKEKDYRTIVERALIEANPTYPVPVIWGEKEIIRVLQRVQG